MIFFVLKKLHDFSQKTKKNKTKKMRVEWGGTNERPGTDHVTSGPMRGLEKNCTRWRRHTNTQTEKRTWQLHD